MFQLDGNPHEIIIKDTKYYVKEIYSADKRNTLQLAVNCIKSILTVSLVLGSLCWSLGWYFWKDYCLEVMRPQNSWVEQVLLIIPHWGKNRVFVTLFSNLDEKYLYRGTQEIWAQVSWHLGYQEPCWSYIGISKSQKNDSTGHKTQTEDVRIQTFAFRWHRCCLWKSVVIGS